MNFTLKFFFPLTFQIWLDLSTLSSMPKRTRPGSKLFKSIISKLLYMDSFQEHPICKQEYVNIYWLYLGIECPYFGGLVDLLAFFLWRSLICCDVRPEKKWENIVHRHYSQAPSKRPLGSFFCTTEIIKYLSKKGNRQCKGCVTPVITLLRIQIILQQHVADTVL